MNDTVPSSRGSFSLPGKLKSLLPRPTICVA